MSSKWRPLFPGWALDPPGWHDQGHRSGWTTRYTTIGARPPHLLIDAEDRHLSHALSATLVATRRNGHAPPADSDIDYWVTLARRLMQRGTNPPVGGAGAGTEPITLDPDVLWSVFPESDSREIEDSLGIDEHYEAGFVRLVRARSPHKATFLIPQAPLESTGVGERGSSTQWVDFLFAPPSHDPVVFEIDGRQHDGAKAVDAERDRALRSRGVACIRSSTREPDKVWTPFIDHLRTVTPGVVNDDATAQLKATIESVRLCYGIVEAVTVGFLGRAGRWLVSARIPDENVVEQSLSVLAALDAVWSTNVMPQTIEFTGSAAFTWHNPFGGVVSDAIDGVRIIVEWGPTWARLPADGSADVVMRGVPLPAHPGWDPDLSDDRRALTADQAADDRLQGALTLVAELVYDIPSFRSGQLRALRRVLCGGDSCVLLPTGQGKTLIYQIAMMLRPGLTIVVAPITSLIDDQERRFLQIGIDRVAALHAARTTDQVTKRQLTRSIAAGTALVTLVSPERLQVSAFRDALLAATERRLVGLAVVDEAHCVSEWGHDFRTSYLRVGRNLRRLCAHRGHTPPPLLALTGTASPGVLRDVLRELEIDGSQPEALQRPDGFDRQNLHFEILRGSAGESFELLRAGLLERIPDALELDRAELIVTRGRDTASGIVFVPWSRGDYGVEAARKRIEEWFADEGLQPPAVGVYAGRNPHVETTDGFDRSWSEAKATTAQQFQSDELAVLVATKAFGMGIDKPNIRWTIHLGIPSSIEAFAQEAGRAGRGPELTAHCVIASGQVDEDLVRALLDPRTSSQQRRKLARAAGSDDDIGRQLFFLYNSFPGVESEQLGAGGVDKAISVSWVHGEANQAISTWDRLVDAGAKPEGLVRIPRLPTGSAAFPAGYKATLRSLVDKALFRLSIVGVIDDLTVDYGADTVTVKLTRFDSRNRDGVLIIDAALSTFASRIQPGRHRDHVSTLAEAPVEINARIAHHLRYVVDLVYAVIEPARLNALRSMWSLTLNKPDDERIRRTISAYLGDSLAGAALAELMDLKTVDVADAVRRLDAAQPGDEYDWAGASTRLLETFPGHPILLAARAAGEAQLPAGTVEEFGGFVREMLDNAEAYGIGTKDRSMIFEWLQFGLLNFARGERSDWIPALWAVWLEHEDAHDDLDVLSRNALRDLTADPYVLDAARAHRLALLAGSTDFNLRSLM